VLKVLHGDCRDILPTLEPASFDACVTDPPYEIGFMGKEWDRSGVAFDERTWKGVFHVLKPGAHVLAFGGTRTYHRLVCAMEDAGFEIRDQIGWLYGSGFPKSLDVSKAIDKAAGAERSIVSEGKPEKRMIPGSDQNKTGWLKDNGREFIPQVTEPATQEAKDWEGWGTALKPAWEPIVLARKPLSWTVAGNVLKHGTGALNINACRVDGLVENPLVRNAPGFGSKGLIQGPTGNGLVSEGRWPANVIHDGSEEVLEHFAKFGDDKGAFAPVTGTEPTKNGFSGSVAYGGMINRVSGLHTFHGDSGTAARFFYCAKASGEDREEWNTHPTVKPTSLMRYLCRLITPPGGKIVDICAGSGSTGRAALMEGFSVVLIEQGAENIPIINRRCAVTLGLGL